jgi:protein phosphatase
MRLQATGQSDRGKKRENNEDSLLMDDSLALYAVADGIGGQSGGEVASRMAVETLGESLAGLRRGGSPAPDEPALALAAGFRLANSRIIDFALANPDLEGMGTTMTALFVNGSTAHVAHVGDSRAYLFRHGRLTQITDDHGFVAEQVRAGLVTPEQARRSPYRHIITRALGIGQDLKVDLRTIEAQERDVFLLCTDGLTEMVEDHVIERILDKTPPGRAAGELVDSANGNGGVDNITVVVVRVGDL